MIESYHENTKGKDYICSDIHGHFSVLEAQLDKIDFDETTDRLFCLGDIIDRGDESILALRWLKKSWFHAIQGNHERMLVSCFENRDETMLHQWHSWGGEWASDMSYDELRPFYAAFSRLPVAIEIKLPNNSKVGLIHAELPNDCDWKDIAELLRNATSDSIESNPEIHGMIWDRFQPYLSLEEATRLKPVGNVDHVFHGHTIVDDYLTLSNRTFMDLGSYKTGKIGLINPEHFFKPDALSRK